MPEQLDLPFSSEALARIVGDAVKAALAGQPVSPTHRPYDRMLTVSECAHRIGMSDKGFRKLCRRGAGPEILIVGERRQGVKESAFLDWLATRQPVRRGRAPRAAA